MYSIDNWDNYYGATKEDKNSNTNNIYTDTMLIKQFGSVDCELSE